MINEINGKKVEMKDYFLLDKSVTFLNHGSFGACPAPVFSAYQDYQLQLERNPVEFLGRDSASRLFESRKKLAEFLGTIPGNIIFITNATTAVNSVAGSLNFQPGDEILASNHEYGACNNAWKYICSHNGAHYKQVKIPLPFDSEAFLEKIKESAGPRTKMIFLSHITSTTACLFPVAEICRWAKEKGILTLIDGAHAPGQIDLNLDELGADYYTGNCHKWLCAPKGAAFLYASPEMQEKIDGNVISWGYSEKIEGHTGFEAYTGSTLFEKRHQWQGTRDISAFLAVRDAVDFREKWNWDHLREKCRSLLKNTVDKWNQLFSIDPVYTDSDYSQMAVVPVPKMNADLLKKRLFDEYNIEIPVTSHEDRLFLRISVQAYNNKEDIDILTRAVKEIYQQ